MLKLSNEDCRRVLVVDDHRESRVITSYLLAERGHVVDVADDDARAVAAICEFRPDIVLLEWNLRERRGVGLVAKLRAEARVHGLRIRVVVLSTQFEPAGFRSNEQVDGYLLKPVEISELERELRIH